MWLMEHNPEIDLLTGDISMMRCLASCRLKTAEGEDQLNHVSANKTWKQSKAHLHHQVHVEEVSESHSAHDQTEPPPGFAHTNPDGLDKGDQLFIQFIGAQVEEIGATQMGRGRAKVLRTTQVPHNIHSNPGPAKPRGPIQIGD